jgi:hypothetical protein
MTPTALTASTFVSCLADLNSDGSVNGLDLCILLACYGEQGDDPVQLGQCPSYAALPAWQAEMEAQFRLSVVDVPTSFGAPYSVGFIIGDFNRNGMIDGPDLSVLLIGFGCERKEP